MDGGRPSVLLLDRRTRQVGKGVQWRHLHRAMPQTALCRGAKQGRSAGAGADGRKREAAAAGRRTHSRRRCPSRGEPASLTDCSSTG